MEKVTLELSPEAIALLKGMFGGQLQIPVAVAEQAVEIKKALGI